MSFWLAAGALLCGVLLVLLGSILRARPGQPETIAAGLYRQRFTEVEDDVREGAVDLATAGELKEELARAALEEDRTSAPPPLYDNPAERWGAMAAILLIVPAIAVPVYLGLGTPELAQLTGAASPDTPHATPAQLIAQLQERIARAPQDPEPRLWLARVYMASAQFGKAVDEFAALQKLVGDVPAVLLQYADALAMLNGGSMSGRPAALVQQVLAAEPDNATALWLAGLTANEAGRSDEALAYLRRARQASLEQHLPTEELDGMIAGFEARSEGGPVPRTDRDANDAPTGPGAAVNAAAIASAPRIEVAIRLDEGLQGRVAPDATLFVLARAPQGLPMPLAVRRLPASSLPVQVTLDDTLAMAPGANLSSVKEVLVVARISNSGRAIAASGDLQGVSGPIAVSPDAKVEISITDVVP